jgi:hypothetical protein
MSAWRTAGITRSAQRVPKARRRSWALANFFFSWSAGSVRTTTPAFEPIDEIVRPAQSARASTFRNLCFGSLKTGPVRSASGVSRRKTANSGAIGRSRSAWPFSSSARIRRTGRPFPGLGRIGWSLSSRSQ